MSSRTTREDERKYGVHGLFTLPDLVDESVGICAVRPQPALTLEATYYDAQDLRLARDGITLRHRTGEGPPTWHLKLPVTGGSGTARDEIAVPGDPDTVPPLHLDLLTAHLRGAPLRAVATLQTDRDVRLLVGPQDEELAEVVDDVVSVLDGDRMVSRFREVEVERREISDEAMDRVGERLVAAGAVAGEFQPKVVRALGPQATAPSSLPDPPKVTPDLPAALLVALSLRVGLSRLVGADIGVRRDEHDAVHQMRVACRRMRSDLRTFGALVRPEWADPLRAELAWLAGAAGAARDLEVLRARLVRTAQADELAPLDPEPLARIDVLLERQEEEGRAELLEAVRSERYLALLRNLVDIAAAPATTELAQAPCAQALPPLVKAVWKQLAKRARRLEPDGPDDDWHEVRIRAKRARYAAEAVVPVMGKPAARTATAAESVQELLGEHQDAVISADRVTALAREHWQDGALCLAAGRLVERERQAVRAARAAFPAVWREAERSRNVGWFSK